MASINSKKIERANNGSSSNAAVSAVLSQDITVAGNNVGGADIGDSFPTGTAIENVLQAILSDAIPPTYTAPALALIGSNPKNVEAGTNITPVLSANFTANDGGALADARLYKNAVLLATNTNPFTETTFQIGDETVLYKAEQDYLQGAVKNDNLGTPNATGQIPSGTASSSNVLYNGHRKAFFGVNQVVTASAEIRALGSSQATPLNGTTFTINVLAGTTRIAFAYPDTLQNVSAVKYVELSNSEVKGTFVLTNVSVSGANGFAPIGYKVYEYISAVPFSADATYNVTI